MANRIKGITVEINGDTTKLSKALEGVNKNIRSTQSQLKDVEKLLKLDPTNTELLSQKQKLLADAVSSTKEKLETLKTAAKQANTALANGDITQEQYDALQREIIETEHELQSLEQQAKQSGTALTQMAQTGEKLKTVGTNISNAGQALLPLTGVVMGLGTAAVKTGMDFALKAVVLKYNYLCDLSPLVGINLGMPYTEKPEKFMKYAGPPSFLCNNFTMFLISPLFESIMGMDSSTIYDMLPVSDRKDGVILDSSVTNIDMAKNYNDYPIEELQVPTLIFHAKDDKLASYTDTEKAVRRFPDCTFISFENGGHLMTGHGEEIKKAVSDFTEKH